MEYKENGDRLNCKYVMTAFITEWMELGNKSRQNILHENRDRVG